MNEIETNKQHMEALQSLANANVKISEAKESLSKLMAQETEYLTAREGKAIQRVNEVLVQSKEVLKEIGSNYDKVKEYESLVSEGAKFLSELLEKFSALVVAKETRYEAWEKELDSQEETILSQRNSLKMDAVNIDALRKQQDARNIELNKLERKIQDERGTLDRAIKRLKEKRI